MSSFFAMLCPKCGRSSEHPSEAFGTWIKCPFCRAEVVAKPNSQPPNPAIPFDHPPEKPAGVPDLKACRACGLNILKSADKCMHCGARQSESRALVPIIGALAGIALIVGLIILLAQHHFSAAPSERLLHAGIEVNATGVFVRNDDTFAWKQAEVYLNGSPPYAWRYTLGNVPPGASQNVPLSSFDQSGSAFPIGMKVTNVWVGAPGYDFNSYPIN